MMWKQVKTAKMDDDKSILFGQHFGESEAVIRKLQWKARFSGDSRFYHVIEVEVLNSSKFLLKRLLYLQHMAHGPLFCLFWGILLRMSKVTLKLLTASLQPPSAGDVMDLWWDISVNGRSVLPVPFCNSHASLVRGLREGPAIHMFQ